ncbi:MAG: MarR family transcriptional regulator [Candidatus Omnitrophota bacterium]
MKKQISARARFHSGDLREEYYLKRTLEFGQSYKEFERSSVETTLNLVRACDMVWVHFSKLMRVYGLSPALFNMLMILRQNKGEKLKQHDISKLLLVSRANVTGLVNALVRKSLAKRVIDKNDRRAWLAQITEKGNDLLERYLPIHYGEIRRIFSDFDAAEKQQANKLYNKFKNGIQKCAEKK